MHDFGGCGCLGTGRLGGLGGGDGADAGGEEKDGREEGGGGEMHGRRWFWGELVGISGDGVGQGIWLIIGRVGDRNGWR